MSPRLNTEKIAAMWRIYQDRPSVDYVSKKCGVHWKTVKRYRRLERWDERLAQIKENAQREADYDLATAMADSLRLVRTYKWKLSAALDAKDFDARDVTISELEKLAKLEAYLLGGVESRHEVVGRFESWSDEELEAYASKGELPGGQSSR